MSDRSYLRSKKRSYMLRSVDKLVIRQRFLIVCEGEKTEPLYFKKFRVTSLVVDVKGTGFNTIGLVKKAISLRNEADTEKVEKGAGKPTYDQVWCVFDRDSFPVEYFNEAFQKAKNNGIKIAYSNEAFELWYLLHFHYFNTAITRQDYINILSEKLGHKYYKNSETIFDELVDKQIFAINNAKRLIEEYPLQQLHLNNPSTTVHLLVEQLNRFSI